MSTFWQCFTCLGFVGCLSLCNLIGFNTKYFRGYIAAFIGLTVTNK